KPKNVIGMEKAKLIALKKAAGTITDSELEFEKKQWVYSFDIKGADQKTHEVLINAKTGKVVSAVVETAKDAAAEQKEDAKATQTAK
ncbi:MAG TPA: PepSY domain-containing protein, partial [bacterium]